MPNICVLGAGIIGISSAVVIQQYVPHSNVTIISDQFSPNTTSDVAAGLIEPYLCGDDPNKIIRWTTDTINKIEQYMADGNIGAQEKSGYFVSSQKSVPEWLKIMKNVHILNDEEMKRMAKREDHKFGVFFTTWYLEPTAYIQYCTKIFLKNGGKTQQKTINSVEELDDKYDMIVNCTGLGSRLLFGDQSIRPCRGQIMRVSCPPVKHFFFDDNFYCLLNDDCLILGGTKQMDDWNLEVDKETSKKIFEGNCVNIPALKKSKILSHHVGLRPFRPTIRLEIEQVQVAKRTIPICHNYGHGGSGITLHWGCALDTAKLINDYFGKSHI